MYKLKQCQREEDTTSIRMIKKFNEGRAPGRGGREREREEGDGWSPVLCRLFLSSLDIDLRY